MLPNSISGILTGVILQVARAVRIERVNVAQDLTKVLQGLGGARDPGAKDGDGPTTATDLAGGNKVTPLIAPGAAKLRIGYALPANNTPRTGTRRCRRRHRHSSPPVS